MTTLLLKPNQLALKEKRRDLTVPCYILFFSLFFLTFDAQQWLD